jgi:protein-S-isoprenylcysteine O-methyltransferase Ste14
VATTTRTETLRMNSGSDEKSDPFHCLPDYTIASDSKRHIVKVETKMNRLVIIFLVILVPVLGLGLALLGIFTLSTNMMGGFLILAGLTYAVGVIVAFCQKRDQFWIAKTGGEFTAEEKNDLSFWFILPGMITCFFLSPVEFLLIKEIIPRIKTFQITGLCLVVAGVILFLWARGHLKENYSGHLSVKTNQHLITSGPYRFIRHPGYASFILIAFSVSLAYSSLIGLAAVPVLVVPGLIFRIHREEDLLRNHFGQEFKEYTAHTKRLIPGIW